MRTIYAIFLSLATSINAASFGDYTAKCVPAICRCSNTADGKSSHRHTADLIPPTPGPVVRHQQSSLEDEINMDMILPLVRRLRRAEDGRGPDLGAGLTLDTDLTDEEKQLLIDLKARLKGSGLIMYLSATNLYPRPQDETITKDDLKRFFDADLPEVLHADTRRAAASVSLKQLIARNTLFALLYHIHKMEGDHDGPDYGGGMTINRDLREEDRQLLLDLKIYVKYVSGSGILDHVYKEGEPVDPDIERLRQFLEAEFPPLKCCTKLDEQMRLKRFQRFLHSTKPAESSNYSRNDPLRRFLCCIPPR